MPTDVSAVIHSANYKPFRVDIFGRASQRYRSSPKGNRQVERAITADLLMIGVAREVVAMQPLGFLKSLDAPYVGTETLAKMDAHWKELKDERNSWSKGYEEDLYG